MANDAVEAARQVFETSGIDACTNAQTFRAVFKDFSLNRWEKNMNLLELAVSEGIPALLTDQGGGPLDSRVRTAVWRLTHNRSVKEDSAQWAVQVWAYAVGACADKPADLDQYGQNDVIFDPPPPPEPPSGAVNQVPPQPVRTIQVSPGFSSLNQGVTGSKPLSVSKNTQQSGGSIVSTGAWWQNSKVWLVGLCLVFVLLVVMWSLPKEGDRGATQSPDPATVARQADKAKAEADAAAKAKAAIEQQAAKAKAEADAAAKAKAEADAAAKARAEAAKDPGKPDPEPDTVNQRKVQAFLDKFVVAYNRATPEELAGFYDSSVILFDKGVQTRQNVLEDLQRYFKRWPTRRSNLIGRIEVFDTRAPDVKKAVFSIRYYRERSGDPSCASGSARYTCLVRIDGSTCYIREISEDIDRDPKGMCVKI